MKTVSTFAITSLAFLTCCLPVLAIASKESQKTCKLDQEILEDSGLRFKGNSSYRSSAHGFKRPLKIDEDYHVRHFGKKTKESLLMKPEGAADWKKIGKNLDLFADYLAATSLLASLDSYVGAPHNYYLLVDKADQKTRLLPWDVNKAFGTHAMGTTSEALMQWDINRPWVSKLPLLERLFATEEFPKLYKQKMVALMEDTFTEKNLFARIATFERALKPHLTKEELAALHLGINGEDSGLSLSTSRGAPAIKPFIQERIKSVQAQLVGKSQGVKIEDRQGRPGGGPRDRPAGVRPGPPNGRTRPGGQ
jgi:hypothetical protein